MSGWIFTRIRIEQATTNYNTTAVFYNDGMLFSLYSSNGSMGLKYLYSLRPAIPTELSGSSNRMQHKVKEKRKHNDGREGMKKLHFISSSKWFWLDPLPLNLTVTTVHSRESIKFFCEHPTLTLCTLHVTSWQETEMQWKDASM